MDRYEQLSMVGEGSYGLVMKCRHKETDQIVAIKKFLETEEDAAVRRMALREIRMLKKLRHENLVTMIEVFRHRKRFYLVFEYLEGTVLDELEKMPGGLGDERSRERIYQVARAIHFCHSNHIIHRDVKPENVLVSSMGVVKLCDFGFARLVSVNGEPCTEYVATRWYRAPELLVGEQQYGAPVDIWAIGCLFAEMMTGDPLFPGESDIDQLYLIVKLIGKPCSRHQLIMSKSTHLRSMIKSAANESNGLYKAFSNWSLLTLDFLVSCMKMDPQCRPSSEELLRHNYFTHDRFPQKFLPALREKVLMEFNANPLLRKYKADVLLSTDRREEIRQRRSLQVEPPKWKLSLTEGSIKRKFSCDAVTSDTYSEKSSSISLKSGQKSLSQKSQNSQTCFIKSKQSLTPKNSQTVFDNKQSDLQLLEKSIEHLAKMANQKSDSLTPKREDKTSSPLEPSSPNYTSFNSSLTDYSKSPNQQILHPSINNISFCKEPQKKSPNFLQCIHGSSIRQTFSQVPLMNPPKAQILKKLDRNALLDSMFMNVEPSNNGTMNRRSHAKKNDGFTLPNLPGASPNKTKKKPDHSPETHAISPRVRSSHSQLSSKFISSFPSM